MLEQLVDLIMRSPEMSSIELQGTIRPSISLPPSFNCIASTEEVSFSYRVGRGHMFLNQKYLITSSNTRLSLRKDKNKKHLVPFETI